jgi:hypothetical protein
MKHVEKRGATRAVGGRKAKSANPVRKMEAQDARKVTGSEEQSALPAETSIDGSG